MLGIRGLSTGFYRSSAVTWTDIPCVSLIPLAASRHSQQQQNRREVLRRSLLQPPLQSEHMHLQRNYGQDRQDARHSHAHSSRSKIQSILQSACALDPPQRTMERNQ